MTVNKREFIGHEFTKSEIVLECSTIILQLKHRMPDDCYIIPFLQISIFVIIKMLIQII